MPEQLVPTLVVAALIVLSLVAMGLGWRNRRRRTAGLALGSLPEETGDPLFTGETLYVATTLREKPMERVLIPGLGMRSRATVQVLPVGVSLTLPGRDAVLVPAASIEGAGVGTFAVDRVVERDGLVVLAWELDGTELDTYLRPASGENIAELVGAVQRIVRGSVASSAAEIGTENPSGNT